MTNSDTRPTCSRMFMFSRKAFISDPNTKITKQFVHHNMKAKRSQKAKLDRISQSLAIIPSLWQDFATVPFSLISESDVLGGTSTAGEQLKNP